MRADHMQTNPNIRLLKRDQIGITSIEFALIAPVFLMLIMGVVEFSMIMFTTAVMESATNNTARLGKTGYVPPDSNRQTEIFNSVVTRTAGLLDPDHITITSQVY